MTAIREILKEYNDPDNLRKNLIVKQTEIKEQAEDMLIKLHLPASTTQYYKEVH